jgi:hypothetical protein
MNLITHLHLVPRLRTSWATSVPPIRLHVANCDNVFLTQTAIACWIWSRISRLNRHGNKPHVSLQLSLSLSLSLSVSAYISVLELTNIYGPKNCRIVNRLHGAEHTKPALADKQFGAKYSRSSPHNGYGILHQWGIRRSEHETHTTDAQY